MVLSDIVPVLPHVSKHNFRVDDVFGHPSPTRETLAFFFFFSPLLSFVAFPAAAFLDVVVIFSGLGNRSVVVVVSSSRRRRRRQRRFPSSRWRRSARRRRRRRRRQSSHRRRHSLKAVVLTQFKENEQRRVVLCDLFLLPFFFLFVQKSLRVGRLGFRHIFFLYFRGETTREKKTREKKALSVLRTHFTRARRNRNRNRNRGKDGERMKAKIVWIVACFVLKIVAVVALF